MYFVDKIPLIYLLPCVRKVDFICSAHAKFEKVNIQYNVYVTGASRQPLEPNPLPQHPCGCWRPPEVNNI